MSTHKEIIADMLDALAPLPVRARAMFGEYCVYCDEMMVALVCDDRFYLKPTAAVESLDVELEPCPQSWRWLPPICGDGVFPKVRRKPSCAALPTADLGPRLPRP